MADQKVSILGLDADSKVHDEADGTFSKAEAAHLRGWDSTDAQWYRLPVDHATGALKVIASLSAGSVDIGTVDQGTGGSSAWKVTDSALTDGTQRVGGTVSLAAETTKVIGTVNQGTSPWVVDTELPAAAALADATSNPTVPTVGSAGLGFNGTTWDRLKVVNAALPLTAITGTGLQAVSPMIVTGSTFQPFSSPTQLGDGNAGQATLGVQNQTFSGDQYARARDGRGLTDANNGLGLPASTNYNYNGSTWDRGRGNYDTTTGDTGTKTATFAGATQTNYNALGAVITIKCGTVSGTSPTLSCQLQWSYDGGTTFLNVGPALANLTATGNTGVINVYPANISQAAGVTPANLTTGATQTMALNWSLPRLWRINYTIAGTSPSFAITAVYVNYNL